MNPPKAQASTRVTVPSKPKGEDGEGEGKGGAMIEGSGLFTSWQLGPWTSQSRYLFDSIML